MIEMLKEKTSSPKPRPSIVCRSDRIFYPHHIRATGLTRRARMETTIGNAAGEIWQCLKAEGPMTLSGLVRTTKLPQPVVHMAVGWLAREDKVDFSQTKRGTFVSLKEAHQQG